MEIVCEGCGAKLSVPEEKLPAAGSAQAACPKCKARVVIPAARAATAGPGYSSGLLERFEEGVPTALVLYKDEGGARQVARAVEGLGYRASRAATVEEAKARIKFNAYGLVVMQEGFGAAADGPSPMLAFFNLLPMTVRRQMFVALVGEAVATLDRMEAFVRSVNLVVSRADLPGLGKILKNSIAEHEVFYGVFNETLRGLGRA